MAVRIYSAKEIEKIAASGKIAYDTHMLLREHIKPGVSTWELDKIATDYIRSRGGRPAFLGFHGFPACLCTSVNDAVVHGVPKKDQILQEGDIIGIDLGVQYEGYFSDTAWTWPVGEVSEAKKRLITVTQEALYRGIKAAMVGNKIGAIGEAVQKHVESNGYSVVKTLVGHGVGKSIHEDPQVPNYGTRKQGPKIKAGMVLAIEPMVNEGTDDVITDKEDGWTVKTADGKMSAHFEHTVAVTAAGPRICTLPVGANINVFELMAS
ncbi:MAG: type I methionyl aminopeptidase [Candidatus Hydrogenedentota bacterium]|nr:MAG: type I methionyl aminopeptidase [Candidatus Hydrogenedentota bacterium]